MKNMGDYHDHHLKKDVLLLADVFEKFIDACLKFKLACYAKNDWYKIRKNIRQVLVY